MRQRGGTQTPPRGVPGPPPWGGTRTLGGVPDRVRRRQSVMAICQVKAICHVKVITKIIMLCNISQNAMRQRGGTRTPPGGYLTGYPPGGTRTPRGGTRTPGGIPDRVPPQGEGYPDPPGGGTQVGQQKEYSLHGGRYASCVHAGGLSCWLRFYLMSNALPLRCSTKSKATDICAGSRNQRTNPRNLKIFLTCS